MKILTNLLTLAAADSTTTHHVPLPTKSHVFIHILLYLNMYFIRKHFLLYTKVGTSFLQLEMEMEMQPRSRPLPGNFLFQQIQNHIDICKIMTMIVVIAYQRFYIMIFSFFDVCVYKVVYR